MSNPNFKSTKLILKEAQSSSTVSTSLATYTTPVISTKSTISNISDVKTKVAYYYKKAKNKNTELANKNWMRKFEEFHSNSGYLILLTVLNNKKQLEEQIVEFISIMKKKDRNEYKTNSVKQAVDAISRYLLYNSPISSVNLHDQYMFSDLYDVLHNKMCDLQEHGFGEVSGSIALNSNQVQEILQHSMISHSSPLNLLYHVFFHLSIILAMRGGEHYELKVDQFKSDDYGVGLQKGQAHVISISQDNIGPCVWYKKKHIGKNKLMKFMQEIGHITKIDILVELLSNYSECKTATQCLQDHEIPEQAIIELTDQQLHTSNMLINLTEGSFNDNLQSRVPLQEITSD
ncbi:17383_t:CDS:2 [Racocetra persica]|uniref:17383_t:CDS:1 n=1 Tax=Racocetra persica TaxID=160502 RepID=A0ACA9MTC3_9GLOM|nr:17383_t:CDS:2 [Racocetra persica]